MCVKGRCPSSWVREATQGSGQMEGAGPGRWSCWIAGPKHSLGLALEASNLPAREAVIILHPIFQERKQKDREVNGSPKGHILCRWGLSSHLSDSKDQTLLHH